MKKIDALDISAYFLDNIYEFNDSYLTVRKLYKVLYYAQVWYLVNFGVPLFEDDIVTWEFGPYIMLVESAYGCYGYASIEDYGMCNKELLGKKRIEFLDEFLEVFGQFSATHLWNMIKIEDPWIKAYKKGEGVVIDLEDMKEFYTKLLNKGKKHG